MVTKNLLVELFVEELPPKALKKLGEAFAEGLFAELGKTHSLAEGSVVTAFASPRRLAAHITSVLPVAAQRPKRVKLMPVSVGYDAERQPTPALRKKLEALGFAYLLSVDRSVWDERISEESDGKSVTLFHTDVAAGLPLQASLQMILEQVLTKLPIPKAMSYQLQDGWTTVNFVRPVHGLVVLHGAEEVKVRVLGLDAGRSTQGHRFEAPKRDVQLRNADSYSDQLREEGGVIAGFEERRTEIAQKLNAAAVKVGLKPIDDAGLLDEVTGLVERPNVLLCRFDEEFLDVPQECLILTMKANQKYFPLLDAQGKLTNKFLVVSNIQPEDASRVIEGNERVVRPRLADAKFFFDQDRKKTLESRVVGLAKVVYHNKLGTQGERTLRVRAIAKAIAATAFPYEKLSERADRAAALAKADLLTDMVGEFPELQGVMGAYYARHDGESQEVAEAIEDHYKPRFSGDELPRSKVGSIVAMADKLETLVGLFGIGQLPTGDKDPFALRRHALGLIRMLTDQSIPIGIDSLIALSVPVFGAAIDDPSVPLLAFIYDRLAGGLREQGYSTQEVDAVLSQNPQQLADVMARLRAVRAFTALPEASSLAAANKRVVNILKKSASGVLDLADTSLPKEPAEEALQRALLNVETEADIAFRLGDYSSSLQALAALKAPVDAFFDTVMVNAEDPALRANRLVLLNQLRTAMNRVADLSKLAA
jgi:glycyl-tRNA synthetase beta chain